MADRPNASRTLNAETLAEAKDELKSLGGFGEGLGRMLESLAKISENSGQEKSGDFSIGGPKSPLRGAYQMRVGSVPTGGAPKRAKPAPVNRTAAKAKAKTNQAAEFSPNLFQTDAGVMVVAETGAFGADKVAVSVDESGLTITITTPDHKAAVPFAKPVDPASLNIAVVNGIMTANAAWKED